jgi:hypothetical protein
MRIFVRPHQHKADAIIRGLAALGHKLVRKSAEAALFDHGNAYGGAGMNKLAERCWERGATIVLYPHAVTPPWWYDGLWDFDRRIAAILTTTETHREIVAGWGLGCEVHAIGWPYCEQRPFEPADRVQKILFGPIHPPINGTLREEALESNRAAMAALQALLPDVQVTVRYIHELDRQGLWRHPGMTYVRGEPNGSHREIDEADLVIGEGMFLHLAVARGKPAISLNQRNPIRPNNGLFGPPKHWAEFADLVSYSLDMHDGPLKALFEAARRTEQTEWRNRNVGETMDPRRLDGILAGIRARDLARRGEREGS